MELPPFAPGTTLDLVWAGYQDTGERPRTSFIATREKPSRFGFMTLSVQSRVTAAGHLRTLVATGTSNVGIVHSRHVDLHLDARFCAALGDLDVSGTVRGAVLGDLSVATSNGICAAVQRSSGLLIEDALNADLSSLARDLHVTCRHVTGSRFDGLRVTVEPDGALQDCVGRIALVSAVRGRILTHPPGHLVIGTVSDDATPIDDKPELDGATLVGVYIEAQSVRKILDAAESAAQFDLAPEGAKDLVSGLPATTRLQVAERMHALLVQRARNPHTIDRAKAALLDARRESAKKHNVIDYLLLSLSRLFQYGQSVVRPGVAWVTVVAIILAHRVITAIDVPNGFIGTVPAFHVHVDGATWVKGGDVLLSTVLLPANWVRLQEAAPAVGLSGGYLSAARLILLILVLLFLTAARRRLRVSR